MRHFKKNTVISTVKDKYNTSILTRGSFWSIAGYGGEFLIRIVSSMVFTRLFLPDVFGLMAIINSLIIGMEMVSETGLRASIITNKNGRKKYFLETAWSIQIIRGLILWVIIALLSYPLSLHFNEFDLVYLLPIAGLSLIIRGFSSVSIHLYSREMGVSRLVLCKLGTHFLSLLIVLTIAFFYKSIWLLVMLGILNALISTIFSHFFFERSVTRFRFDKGALLDIIKYGKWLFFASIFHFLVGQGDKLIIGSFVTKSELGLYRLASIFSQIPMSLLGALVGAILMPYLSNSFRQKQQLCDIEFNQILKKILLYMLPFAAALALLGNSLIQLFYPVVYHEAGLMLTILATGAIFQVIAGAFIPIFMASGDSFRHMLTYLLLLILFLPLVFLGQLYWGVWGAIFGVVLSHLLWLPMVLVLAKKYVSVDVKYLAFRLMLFLVLIMGSNFAIYKFFS